MTAALRTIFYFSKEQFQNPRRNALFLHIIKELTHDTSLFKNVERMHPLEALYKLLSPALTQTSVGRSTYIEISDKLSQLKAKGDVPTSVTMYFRDRSNSPELVIRASASQNASEYEQTEAILAREFPGIAVQKLELLSKFAPTGGNSINSPNHTYGTLGGIDRFLDRLVGITAGHCICDAAGLEGSYFPRNIFIHPQPVNVVGHDVQAYADIRLATWIPEGRPEVDRRGIRAYDIGVILICKRHHTECHRVLTRLDPETWRSFIPLSTEAAVTDAFEAITLNPGGTVTMYGATQPNERMGQTQHTDSIDDCSVVIITNLSARRGDSGSLLLDTMGRIIGILVGKIGEVYVATPSVEARAFILECMKTENAISVICCPEQQDECPDCVEGSPSEYSSSDNSSTSSDSASSS